MGGNIKQINDNDIIGFAARIGPMVVVLQARNSTLAVVTKITAAKIWRIKWYKILSLSSSLRDELH